MTKDHKLIHTRTVENTIDRENCSLGCVLQQMKVSSTYSPQMTVVWRLPPLGVQEKVPRGRGVPGAPSMVQPNRLHHHSPPTLVSG